MRQLKNFVKISRRACGYIFPGPAVALDGPVHNDNTFSLVLILCTVFTRHFTKKSRKTFKTLQFFLKKPQNLKHFLKAKVFSLLDHLIGEWRALCWRRRMLPATLRCLGDCAASGWVSVLFVYLSLFLILSPLSICSMLVSGRSSISWAWLRKCSTSRCARISAAKSFIGIFCTHTSAAIDRLAVGLYDRSPDRWIAGVTVRCRIAIARWWVRLPVGSISSGYCLHGWLSADRLPARSVFNQQQGQLSLPSLRGRYMQIEHYLVWLGLK